jgi:hypothetical protein
MRIKPMPDNRSGIVTTPGTDDGKEQIIMTRLKRVRILVRQILGTLRYETSAKEMNFL